MTESQEGPAPPGAGGSDEYPPDHILSMVKTQQRRRLGYQGHFTQALRRYQKRVESKQQPIPRAQIWGPPLRTFHDEQLMLDGERFRHDRANTAGTGKSREGHQQVAEQWEQQFHSERNSNRLSTVGKSALHRPVLPKSAIRHTQAKCIISRYGGNLLGYFLP